MRTTVTYPKTRKIPVRAELVEAPAGCALDDMWPDLPLDTSAGLVQAELRANGIEVAKEAGNVDQALVCLAGNFITRSRASTGVSL